MTILWFYSSAFRHHVFPVDRTFTRSDSLLNVLLVRISLNEWVWNWPERFGSCCFGVSVIIWTDYNSSCFLTDLSHVARLYVFVYSHPQEETPESGSCSSECGEMLRLQCFIFTQQRKEFTDQLSCVETFGLIVRK